MLEIEGSNLCESPSFSFLFCLGQGVLGMSTSTRLGFDAGVKQAQRTGCPAYAHVWACWPKMHDVFRLGQKPEHLQVKSQRSGCVPGAVGVQSPCRHGYRLSQDRGYSCVQYADPFCIDSAGDESDDWDDRKKKKKKRTKKLVTSLL